jgi:DNA-binding NtrC family response regulator
LSPSSSGRLQLDPGTPAAETILVVDDEAVFRSLVVRQLNGAGYNTMEAADGIEAISIFAERSRDISAVLLDLVMPNSSGSDTLAMLRYYSPALPVVITSGYSANEARLIRQTERDVGFLEKPFSKDQLTAELSRVLGKKSRHSGPLHQAARAQPPVTTKRTIRVLLLEDNEDDQELVRIMLSRAKDVNFDLETVSTLQEAIDRLTTSRYDAVLVDLTLPDSRDVDTIRNLHLRVPEMPLIALTGQDDMPTELAALAIGAQDYLIKGQDDVRMLTRAIRHAMERKRLENGQALLTNQLKKALAEIELLKR